MWPEILLLIAAAAAAWFMLERSQPWNCPHCQRFNAFRRRKTGLSFRDMGADGILIQISRETVCKRCGQTYWITWDDHNGRCATKDMQRR